MRLNRRLLSPRRWTPPSAPADEGRTHATRPLTVTRSLSTGGHGPEDVTFDQDGYLLTGLEDGSVIRLDIADGHREVVGNTGGRPLGVHPSADGSILICDYWCGLLRMAADGSVEVLVDSVAGTPLTGASTVVEGPDGTIWFTVCTRRWDLEHNIGEFYEHSSTGMLIQYDADGTVAVLHDDLKFANGVMLAPDHSHLLVAETAGYRITRHWLTGPKAGTAESFVDNLAGMPDNLSLGSDGLVWVAIVVPRNPLLDKMLPLPGLLRTLLWNLPKALRPGPPHIAWVMAFDLSGHTVHDLRATDAGYGFITSVAEFHGTMVAGSIEENDIAVFTSSPRPQAV